jgi:hypothetical protein
MLGVKTQTFGPKVAVSASGQMLAAACLAVLAGLVLACGAALACKAPPASMAAATTAATASGLIERCISALLGKGRTYFKS